MFREVSKVWKMFVYLRGMAENEYIASFSDYLFWDIDKSSLKLEDHASYIVGRVLELGQLQDWNLLVSYYGFDRILKIATNLRTLEPRALSFLSALSSTPKSAFRCYSQR